MTPSGRNGSEPGSASAGSLSSLKTAHRPDLSPSVASDRRRFAFIVIALLASVGAGLAVCHFPPLLAFAAVLSAVSAYLLLTRPFLGLLVYTVLFMWRPGEVYPVLDSLHAERIVGIITLVGMFLHQYQTRGHLFLDNTRQTRLLLLVLVTVLVSVPFSFWRSAAVGGLVDFLKIVGWYLLVVHLVTTRLRLRVYLFFFLASIGKVAFDALRAYVSGNVMVAQGIDRAMGQSTAGGDPNALAATLAAAVPLLLLLAVQRSLRWVRSVAAAAALLLTVTLSLTGSRSGMLGFLAGLFFLFWHTRRRLLVGVLGTAAILFGLVLLPGQYKARYSTIGASALDASSRGRVEAWKAGVRMTMDRPLTGVGVSCFGTAHAMGYSPESHRSWLQAHSLYVQVPAELGLLGAAAFFGFLVQILCQNRRAFRLLPADDPHWGLERAALSGFAAGVVVLLVTGVFGHSFLRYTWYVYGGFTLAIARLDGPSSVPAIRPTSYPVST